jgi:VanZ family protein
MRSLRYRGWWFAAGFVLVLAVVVMSLLPRELAEDTLVRLPGGHVIAYFVLAFWFAGLVERDRQFVVVEALLVLGTLLELAQGLVPGRTVDGLDLAANAAGLLAAYALVGLGLDGWPRWIEARVGSPA